MAQRLIHKLLSDIIIKAGSGEYIEAPDRFAFGSLLPDAYNAEDTSGIARRDASILTHFKSATPDMEYRYFDFSVFYRKYNELMMTDDLYLGYYIHLVEDAYYRYYIHVVREVPRSASPEQVTFMHKDYHLLNAYIVGKYSVRDDIEKPSGFEHEKINELYQFDTDTLLGELRQDYFDEHDSQPRILTEDILDGFVEEYAPKCFNVVKNVKTGGILPDPLALKWPAGKNKDYL